MNKRRDMRILFQSNPPHSRSGYGAFTADILPRLKKDGWPIAFSAFTNLQGNPMEWEGIKFYGTMEDVWGSDALVAHSIDWKADITISFQDVPPLNPQFLQQIKHWIPYVPVDREPASSVILNNLRYAYKIISFSKFGQTQLSKAGFFSECIVEGVDTNVYKPLNKQETRTKLGMPVDAIVIGMTGANKENPPRKGWQEGILAFHDFLKNHPKAFLFANFQQQHIQGGGFPIREFCNHLGIGDKLIIPNDYKVRFASTAEQQNEFYNSMDILLHPSQTEGFGLCLIEAQSAGIPVVIHNTHSMPELIVEGKTGFGASTLYKQFKSDLSYFSIADPKSVHEALEKTYKLLTNNREKVTKDCRDHVVANYNIDTLYKEQWVPLLETLQSELLPLPVK